MITRTLTQPAALGDVILRAHYRDDGVPESVEVVEAAPRVLISGELLRALRDGRDQVPFAAVDRAEVGGVLTIWARDRNLVYRLTGFEPVVDGIRWPDTYVGEWPD